MAVSEETPRGAEKLLSSAEKVDEPTLAYKVRAVFWTGSGLIMTGFVILGAAAILAAFWTTAPGTCMPPPGGGSTSCPASELTTNNFAVVITLMIWSAVMVALGGVLVCLAWLHKPASA